MEKWVVTGAAGFIGSNLVEELLSAGKSVVGIDNFSTGKSENIDMLFASLPAGERKRFTFTEGDVRDADLCGRLCKGASVILHHAALASVPLSLKRPGDTFDINCGGFLNILEAARINKCRLVYASSSAVYGNIPELPKRESSPLAPLSPYGLSKMDNEQWGSLYWQQYGVETVGFRYFNIYGARQDPHGDYAAVIAAWTAALRGGQRAVIYGDGSATRDFCFIGDVVRANILAATTEDKRAFGSLFNIASGHSVTLSRLYKTIEKVLKMGEHPPLLAKERPGDILHSSADISKARSILGYTPGFSLEEGLKLLLAENRES